MKKLIFISLLFILNSSFLIHNCPCQWVQMSSGMGNDKTVYSLTASGINILAGSDDYGIWRSTNNGQNWSQTTLNNKTVWSFLISGNNIFAGTDNGIFISYDNGQSWSQMALNNETVLSFAISGNNIFAGAYGVYLSTNNGQSWAQTSLNNIVVLSLAINGNNIFAGTSDNSNPSGVWRSTNNGQNWTQTSLNDKIISSLAISGNNIFAGTSDYPNPNGIYRSTNNGQTWTQTVLNNQDIRYLSVYGNNILAGTYYGGFWLSTNNGLNWIQRNEGLTYPFVRPLLIINNYIFGGTYGHSVWRRPLSEIITGIKNISTEIPSVFSLEQNYPNPFNSMTNFKFSIPLWRGVGGRFITLKVFDISGKEVSTLVNEKLNPGTYEVRFESGNLPSGIYFYRMETEKFTETKKLILLK